MNLSDSRAFVTPEIYFILDVAESCSHAFSSTTSPTTKRNSARELTVRHFVRDPVNAIVSKTDNYHLRKKRQVKAKKSAPLEQVFVRVKTESKLDKVRQDLTDAINRVKRINRHFDDVLIKKFASTDPRLIPSTRSVLQTLNVHLHDCSNLVDNILLKEVKFYLKEKNLPLIKSRGYK
ncbi:hypothetical protein DYB32_010118 [Aphanomyces invadans]|uniref:Uncharacterized protein n=1 Tax=Aphanomyces invadans TaxID=157072 RepID=A0A3R6YRN2_9STRA|nr:hypothetical protein DYB32_010118 [Aphanomyces invadans]